MAASGIRCQTRILKPVKSNVWLFTILPKTASAKLPSRGMVTVAGTLANKPFTATLEPDGQGSHWLKIPGALRKAANVQAGDKVPLVFSPVAEEPEPKVPVDLRKALSASPTARKVWHDITPVARRDWIFWITSGKKAETRQRRITTACDMLAKGKRRACCFDRSGIYSKGLSAPDAAD